MERMTVEDLLAEDIMRGAVLSGGAVGLRAPVSDVALVEPPNVSDVAVPRHGALVFAIASGGGPARRRHLVDVLQRRAHGGRASAVVVCGDEAPAAVASTRLADLFGIPLVWAPEQVRPLDLAVTLRTMVRAPEVTRAGAILTLARTLRSGRRALPEMLASVGGVLGASVAACTAQGVFVEGPPPALPVGDIVAVRTPTPVTSDAGAIAILPVLDSGGQPRLWVTAASTRGGPRWSANAVQALTIAHGELAAWLARQQVTAERDARLRSTLLTEILEHGDAIPGPVVEQAALAGWQLEGWHTGIHLTAIGIGQLSEVPPFTMETLTHDVAAAGLELSALVERADGWSAWLTRARPPGPEEPRRICRALEAGLAAFAARADSIAISGGVGTPTHGTSGIATTLAEARQAAVIAASTGHDAAVRTVQDIGPSRLLLGWYTSGAFHDYADQLIAPLRNPHERTVLRTLEAYLDRACSAAQTARALGVHRNTVAQRTARAEELLGLQLNDSETRLALQLALRVTRTGQLTHHRP